MDFNQRIAALSPEQRALFELRLKQKELNVKRVTSISKRKASDRLTLSLIQERLWVLHQLQPDIPLYNESSLFRLIGDLNTIVFEKSLNEIIQRHEILRTSFQIVDSQPVQVIAPTLTVTLPIVDLQGQSETERKVKVKQIVTTASSQPFDLTQAPLLRGTLIRVKEQEHIMLLTMHHIISDGWSWKVFYQELAALYQAFCNGERSPLAELPIQYADFALWQRQSVDEASDRQLAYWKQQLDGASPVLALPTDSPRPAIQSFRGAREPLILTQAITAALKALSKQEGITLFTLLLAAFKTLLYRYTGQTDLLVGTPIANRTQIETENLLGCFVNTLVLRTDISSNPSFRELLARVRETTLAAYANQDVPFEQLVKELQPERALSYNPLFQVMFVFQDAPLLALELPDLTLTPLIADSGIAKFDLTLFLEDTKHGLMGALEYNTDLFKADTITRMLGHFQALLESIVANPDRQVADLTILTAAERHQLLVEFNQNQSKIQHPKSTIDRCLHHLIEAQVEQTPDAVAVVFENEQLTYRELNCRANQLAHYLQLLGVKPEVLVGICLDRSLEMAIALLGILKAGGAYVPLDPTYPKERLAFVIEETQLPVLLTQQHLRESIPQHQAHTVCVDTEWQAIALHSQENIDSGVRSKNLAYTIYTSGSTGKPKGVQITHDAAVNFLNSMRQEPGLSQQDVLLAITTISFDIAALELYLPLIVGAKIVLVSREVASDGVQLSNILAHGVTVMQATPATWQLLLESGWQGNKQLKMLCGGEAMTRSLADRLLQKGNSLWNMYGPSETTIWSTARKVEPGTDSVAIGRPIANTQIYLLDPHLQPVPIGVPGELYIGGDGVARGYLNRSDLTAQRFIPNPFSDRQGNRLYKTGDLARYLPDGNIEYLGRIDYQVKIRGFRIELGEIETVMRQHPAVREAIAIVREQPQKSLVAYVVPNQHPAPAINDLRSFLKERLPEYMVPAAFVLMDALPLTANGKVDRQALPTPEGERPVEGTFVAANTPLEEMLAGIWTQILGLEQVGIHDNFFELGGHSLLATQAISQVRQTFQVEIPLRRLFEAPTVAELAKQIEMAMQAKSELKLPIEQISREGNLPLSFAQQRLWFLYQLDPGSTAYNGSTAVRLQGLLDRRALEQSINEVVRRHETLRTCFAVVEGRAVQKIADALTVSLPLVDLQDLPQTEREAEVLRLGRVDTQQPFDLTQAPLMRLTLVRLDSAEHVLWVTMHHIISDAWSAGVFIREISALYDAFCTKKPVRLPELPIQYADFAVWQQQWLQGEVLDTQLAYWKRQLDGAKTVLELPTDRPRTPLQTSRGAKHSFALSPTLSQSLKSLSQQAGVTLFMTLLAGFNALLYRYTGQEDILIGSPIANRNRSEIEGLIAFFVNTLVLRTALSNNPSFAELLQQVREVALGAYTHQDLPFEKLVAELQLERNLSHAPLFQVWFVLQNAPVSTLDLPGLKLSFLETESGTVRHDLKLDLTETAEGIKGFFEYKADLFNATTIARMAEFFERLLVLVVEEPNIKLTRLVEVLNEEENQQQILKNQELKEVRRQKLGKIGRKAITDIVQ